jgi:hypothetical protein
MNGLQLAGRYQCLPIRCSGRLLSLRAMNTLYNPDVIIGTESWLRQEVSNAEVFRDDYTTFMRDRNTRGGGVFICVKKKLCLRKFRDDSS